MSDDDERMDRAERIKNLRQGRRGGDPEQTDTDAMSDDSDDDSNPRSDDADAEKPTADDAEADESEQSPDTVAGAGDTAESDEPTETAENADSAKTDVSEERARTNQGDGQPSKGAETNEDGADSVPGESDSDEDADALSAAEAAARAAAEFETDTDLSDAEATGDAAASETPDEAAAPAGATIAGADVEETTEEETRVLEFRLGEERYCLDIEYVEEIVREESVTRVPNTPEYVTGVVDLRGQITTILDPKVAADIETDDGDRLMIVFDADVFEDHGEIGWLVDAVDQVSLIAESDVKESPIQEPYINGVIEREDEFVIWTTPELALDVEETD
ncbi:CheW protein [Halorhabdus utahensis DSM 12940]|uniref:CheW protein n=1 Tax=Halorhabdus utahensis (strain DSM 12940 / JCM 11049 / AX-2) TaxID=519442 RepID=C7NTF3_HALUD|nr:chemotaxis protein CheW [Halorhabdus utahensis]ACV10875.1 CheW protein [Halorhabdus utahensis DSM 12940]